MSAGNRTLYSRDGDLSRVIVDTTLRRFPQPTDLGPWEYSHALFLLGEFSVYERTHDPKYLSYAKLWVDSHIKADGSIDRPIDALDFIMPGNLLLALYEQTGDKKYELAAKRLEAVFENYPRTQDGAFWHAEGDGRQHQLWLDGTYMGIPFLLRQGELSEDPGKYEAEAVKQLLLYDKHLRDDHGRLFYHAYDETGTALWLDPQTHHSAVKWARSIGWYGMALVDVLEVLPQDQPDRPKLISILQQLVKDLVFYQDQSSGLWYQIITQPNLKGNWLETSSSSMFIYTIDIAVKRGYVSQKYAQNVSKGYQGVISKVSIESPDEADISGICEGTNVSDLQYYLDRKRNVNDFHGLGAFLLMNEEVRYNRSAATIVGIKSRSTSPAQASLAAKTK